MLKKALTIFVGLLLVPGFLLAYTSPGKPAGFVNDFANLLKPETALSLENTLQSFSDTTGNQIVVVTVATLGDESVETYSEKLFSEWGIGQEKEDNGLLLLVARDEREMRIEVGYGLEPIITDLESSRIIREVLTPSFKEGKYDEGVTLALDRIFGDITTGEVPPKTKQSFGVEALGALLYPAIILIVFFASILGKSKSWWAGGVIGGIAGIIISIFLGFILTGLISLIVLVSLGLLFDFLVSRSYQKHKAGGPPPWFLGGGGFGGHGGGGFGGFGGGMSGGGGASGRW